MISCSHSVVINIKIPLKGVAKEVDFVLIEELISNFLLTGMEAQLNSTQPGDDSQNIAYCSARPFSHL